MNTSPLKKWTSQLIHSYRLGAIWVCFLLWPVFVFHSTACLVKWCASSAPILCIAMKKQEIHTNWGGFIVFLPHVFFFPFWNSPKSTTDPLCSSLEAYDFSRCFFFKYFLDVHPDPCKNDLMWLCAYLFKMGSTTNYRWSWPHDDDRFLH